MSSHFKRKSMRLKNYNYSDNGAYFVTIAVKNHQCIFGEILNAAIELNQIGKIVHSTWFELTNHFPNIYLDQFTIMPNHIHGIVIIDSEKGAINRAPYVR